MSRKRRRRFTDEEDLNPMSYVSNLSDVMLILAVGIMLALILHWKVPIQEINEEDTQNENEAVTFTSDDLENTEQTPEDARHLGEVYVDPETGTYYIVQTGEDPS